ncbi:MAG: RNA-binding transcriptional accessory protein [Flavobacterium sp.]|nr:RNA-binding transcriptional accessory protein [Flavobacterium sp.]
MTNIQFIKKRIDAPESSIRNTVQLLAEDCTIPFISRYRKDKTGNLDEVAIEQIANLQKDYEAIVKRKDAILKSVAEQNALTPDLEHKMRSAFSLTELEDLYLPFKKKKKTRADVARELGLEPLAKLIMNQSSQNIDVVASKFLTDKVLNEDQALQGARDIVAEQISENVSVRNLVRSVFRRKGVIETKFVKPKKGTEISQETELAQQKFAQYFDWSEPLLKAPSHRLLAMLRGENEGFLKIKIDTDSDEILSRIESDFIKNKKSDSAEQLEIAIADSYKRLLAPALSNEVLQEAKSKADSNSINVFASNLTQLLMAPPLGSKRILAIDPGFRSGCKLVCLDEKGDLLYNETIYPHAPQKETAIAMKKVRSLVNAYKIEAISIGNGTASRETEFFIKQIAFDKPIQVFVVSEAGASVYSASKIAREELPQHDVTVRGAVSIGRRLIDPLAELVKIDPKAIGVGQYQHDVDQTKLKDELDAVVARCVNTVGVNVNTASRHLLAYVSGIGEKTAENIVEYRKTNGPFTSRKQLKKVPRLGEKAFQQSAGFIRIPNGENVLDNSAVHPEAYPIVEKMSKMLKVPVEKLIGNKEEAQKIDISKFVTEEIGILGLKDVLSELEKPGLDPRKSAKVFEFDSKVTSINDLHQGMVLPGIVNNITNFGCFVDIGIKESGLVHISQLKQGFVSDVNEVVKMHQHVQVKVVEVDVARKRVQLSMIL